MVRMNPLNTYHTDTLHFSRIGVSRGKSNQDLRDSRLSVGSLLAGLEERTHSEALVISASE